MTQFWNFGTPPYLGNGSCLKLEVWHADGPHGELTEKMKILVTGLIKLSRDPILEFWDHRHIAGTVAGRNSKFGMQMDPERK